MISIDGWCGMVRINGSFSVSPSPSASVVSSLSPSAVASIIVPSGVDTLTVTLFCMLP